MVPGGLRPRFSTVVRGHLPRRLGELGVVPRHREALLRAVQGRHRGEASPAWFVHPWASVCNADSPYAIRRWDRSETKHGRVLDGADILKRGARLPRGAAGHARGVWSNAKRATERR